MTFELKKAAIRSVVMVFLCAFFILSVEIYQRPDGEGLARELSSLAEYEGGIQIDADSYYSELYQIGAKEVWAYTSEGSREFAIAEFETEAPETATEVYKKRLWALSEEYAQNPDELLRIGDAKIMLINQYAILLIYDTADTAQNLVYSYFDLD